MNCGAFKANQKQLFAVLLMLFFVLSLSCNRSRDLKRDVVDEIKVSDVIMFAKSHFSSYERASSVTEKYDNFDFNSLKPSKRTNPIVSYVKVFYDERRELAKVLSISKFKDSDFEFNFVENREFKYTVFFARQIYDTQYENEQGDVVDGFFLVINNRCFFFGFQEPFCIMELNDDLKAVETLKFRLNRLDYGTKVNYNDQIHLYSETFYQPKKVFEFDKETSVSDVIRQFESIDIDFIFYNERKIGWVKNLDHLPLWIFGGLHEYDFSESK
ncbi:hypothetical protein SAMN04488109_5149 [Chryseolinea serpens]|uniref:Lipoprotein n=1 Tax=Chryseolinea serpens TaxID=947013 RepID=A0A1M5VK42_9BACT|nr:hypothetical protein [Chryseolinea serpens]SHH75293.1 hypothetical protein SAMN04488109_5149 [Chryseolinea serpens]